MKKSRSPESRSRRNWPYALLFLLLLSFPLIRASLSGVTLTGQYEESLGYRYFYTLRQIYDPDPYVFLPQGQLMDLANRGVQLGLTSVGVHPDLLFPRINIFAFTTLGFAYLTSSLAFLLLCQVAGNWSEVLSIVVIAMVPYCDPGISGFSILLQPDYLNWTIAIALFSAWAVTRSAFADTTSWRFGDLALLAILTAASLCTKVTLVIYPFILAMVLISVRVNAFRSLAMAAFSFVAGLVGSLGLLLVYFRFHCSLVHRFLIDEMHFGSSVRPDLAYLNWLHLSLANSDWLLRSLVLMPTGAVLLFAVPQTRKQWGILVGILLGALAYHFMLFFRFQPTTCFEAAAFAVFSVLVIILSVSRSVSRRSSGLLNTFVIVIGVWSSLPGARYAADTYISYLQALTDYQSRIATALAPFGDRIAFLLPDNSYRPLTVDSAIWKGGSNIFEHNRFPASPLLRRMFPHRAYFSELPGWYLIYPADLRPYRAIVFTIRAGLDPGPKEQLKLMQLRFKFFAGDLVLFKEIDFGSERLLIWTHGSPNSAAPKVPIANS